MRNAFIQELVALARRHPHIALIVGDLGYSVVEPFADEFPDRFINAGVAEQNMTGLAAGMASEGYHVFTYSIANFPTFRCAEQIRNDVAYHKLPVTVVSVGGGLAYGALGYSHHAVQDYALMRTLPNMLIAAPGDPMEVRACMHFLVENPSPSYLRLGKAGEPNFHLSPPDVRPGCWLKVREGTSQRAMLTTGAGLQIAMDWIVREEHVDRAVYSMPLWSMADKATQLEPLRAYTEIMTLEDHLQDGGFGSWLLEAKALQPDISCVVRPVALTPDVCGTVGSQATLNRLGGLLP
ncbi:transketolase, C-terminal subunit [Chromobacterium sp. LK1]|uniref:transketolase family protein n=1 Tax=Chromobacterium sp. LK1 TaxID=1628193 RepID=UPI000654AB11|nr:transketolase, C-terminal subunit [Chromobacterium sp. LK1]KMN35839.1 transketolase, C-terminal subunit [Chromobacterium sp. LK1]